METLDRLPSLLGCVYVKPPDLPARGACSELDVALFLPLPFLKGRRRAEEAETLTKPRAPGAEPCPRCPPGPYSHEERARLVPLPQAAHGRRKRPHLGPAGQHGGCIICGATSRSSSLKYPPPLPPPPPHLLPPPASGSGHQPRICSDAPGSPAPVQKQGLICRLAPR